MTTAIVTAQTAQTVRMPRGSAIAVVRSETKAENGAGYRHGYIASLPALVLAITASLLVTGVIWATS